MFTSYYINNIIFLQIFYQHSATEYTFNSLKLSPFNFITIIFSSNDVFGVPSMDVITVMTPTFSFFINSFECIDFHRVKRLSVLLPTFNILNAKAIGVTGVFQL